MKYSNYRGSSEQLTVGAQVQKSRSKEDLERLLSSIRFEHREKLDGLELEIWPYFIMEFESS